MFRTGFWDLCLSFLCIPNSQDKVTNYCFCCICRSTRKENICHFVWLLGILCYGPDWILWIIVDNVQVFMLNWFRKGRSVCSAHLLNSITPQNPKNAQLLICVMRCFSFLFFIIILYTIAMKYSNEFQEFLNLKNAFESLPNEALNDVCRYSTEKKSVSKQQQPSSGFLSIEPKSILICKINTRKCLLLAQQIYSNQSSAMKLRNRKGEL